MDKSVDKLVCMLTKDGKKSKAERIVFDAFRDISKKMKQSPEKVYLEALENVKPLFELKNTKLSGRTQQVPSNVKEERRVGLALRWIIEGVKMEKKRSRKNFYSLLAIELENNFLKKGFAYYKKKRLHRIAETNRGLIQKRWW